MSIVDMASCGAVARLVLGTQVSDLFIFHRKKEHATRLQLRVCVCVTSLRFCSRKKNRSLIRLIIIRLRLSGRTLGLGG